MENTASATAGPVAQALDVSWVTIVLPSVNLDQLATRTTFTTILPMKLTARQGWCGYLTKGRL